MLQLSIGDIVTTVDKESVFFRRDCIVTYVDHELVTIVSEGVDRVGIVELNDANLQLVSKTGTGALDYHQAAILKKVVSEWICVKFLKDIGTQLSLARKKYSIADKDKQAFVRLDGMVSLGASKNWKQFNILCDLVKQAVPEVPENLQGALIELAIIVILNMAHNYPVMLEMGKMMGSSEEGKGDNPHTPA